MVALLWFVFAVIFAYLAFHHWKLSGMRVEPLQFRGSAGWNLPISNIPKASNDTTRIFSLVEDINGFVAKFNSRNRDVNKALMWGYLVAAGTALLSLVLALLQK